jgi:hypothetical protein
MVFLIHCVEKISDLFSNGNDLSFLFLVSFGTFKSHLVGRILHAKEVCKNLLF